MSELLGITGAIGSGKTTLAALFGEYVENHALYETGILISEIGNRFNQLLEAELNFETTDDDIELVNQALIWMPDIIAEQLHHDTTWSHIAIVPKDTRTHPALYEKLFDYLKHARSTPELIEKTITAENKNDYRSLLQWLGGYFVAKISPTIWYDELFRRIDLHDSHRNLVIIGGVRFENDALQVQKHGGRVVQITRPHTESAGTDVTESEIAKIKPDITINNNGTLAQLQNCVETVWNDIAAGAPKKSYSSV